MRHLTKAVSFLAVLTLLATGAAAQTSGIGGPPQAAPDEQVQKLAEQQNWPVKIFEIKQANPGDLFRILNNIFRGQIKVNDAQGTLIVRAPKEIMPAIEGIVKRFDAPPTPATNIELTAYMLVAEKAESNAELPAELEPVVKQLKGVFPSYQGFRLLDTAVLRSREGTNGYLHGGTSGDSNGAAATTYELIFRSARITSDEKGRVIWIDKLHFNARVPSYVGPDKKNFSFQEVNLNADVDLREGQKAVVGKVGIPGSDRTLFLVLTAKVVD